MIGSPELFLAAAGERTHRIMLGTGVVSLPYHHPFNVAQRIVQLDHLTRGRVIFGTGPGALPSDAWTLGIDPMKQRDRQDEALGVIIRLLRGEGRFSVESEWFTLRDAQLQILPLQEDMQMVAASSISPSGMQIAGKYGIGVISIASTSSEGLQALPTQWSFAEEAAAKNGTSVDRKNWRVLMSWHLAESRKQAEKEAKYGLQRWHNEYNVRVLGRPGAKRVEDPDELVAQIAGRGAEGTGAAVVGTPDELVASIRELRDVTGGFGAVIGFAHDWADREATLRSWELFARFVAPEINGYTASQKASAQFLVDNQKQLMGGAAAAVMAKIAGNEKAAAAMAVTMKRMQEQPQGGEWRPGAAPTEVAVEGQDSNGKSPSS
jgi:limonene 1,2-monooxygenase